jgi:ribosomal-protein-alanine N-acetyltransferase
MLDSYFLVSNRLGFREWSQDDLPLAYALWGNTAVTRFIGSPFSEQQIEDRLNKEIKTRKTYGIQYWPVFLLEDGSYVGCAGLRPYAGSPGALELGVHLRPEFWRRGLAEEAARAIIDFGFSELGASTLFAGHHPENENSRRLLTKLGFRFTHEELYAPTGLLHPSYLLARP